ncbi:MAG: DUF2231 domain-containing protein [Dehalococcoidia bacterium]
MRSKFAIAGHPLHPMLIALPIGLFTWAVVCDVVYLATDREKLWYDMAFWAGIGGVITGLIAALPGVGDLLTMAKETDARDIAIVHGVTNVVVVGLFFVAMLLMLDDGATSGAALSVVFVLHLVGLGLLGFAGWLGGEMVYRHHLGMEPDDGELERAESARHSMRPARATRR